MKRLIFLLYILNSFQLISQTDNEFWFAAPEVSSQHADVPVYLHLTSFDQAASVVISIPANTNVQELVIELSPNETRSIVLDQEFALLTDFENTSPDTISNKGIRVKSNQNITAYYEVRGTHPVYGVVNTDIFTLKGKNALGLEFFTPFQSGLENYDYGSEPNCWSSIDIVATEDNTAVTITPAVDAVGHLAKIPFTITLNRGQTFSVKGLLQDSAYSMSGTYIESTKNIAVTVKDDSVIEPNGLSYDLIGDQLVPVNVVGLEYLLSFGENVIVATEDNTTIELSGENGVQSIMLQKGESYTVVNSSSSQFESNNVITLKSDFPVYVFGVKSIGTEYSGGMIPSVDCTGSKKISVSRATDESFMLELFYKTGAGDGFFINGQKIDLTRLETFGEVTSSNGEWSYAKGVFSSGQIIPNETFTITNTKGVFHLGVLNGSSSTGAQYGFFSNFGNLELGADQTLCEGEELVLDAGFGRDNYQWSTGDTVQQITIDTSGSYIVSIVEGTCQATDTINVVFNPSISFDLGSNRDICEFDTIKVRVPNYADSYEWSNGYSDSVYNVTGTDSLVLKIYNKYMCSDADTISFKQILLPKTNLQELIYVCQGTDYLITYENKQDDYLWYEDQVLVDTTSFFNIDQEGEYQLNISNKCGSDSTSFNLVFWNIEVPNVVTPNGDGKNDYFEISGSYGESWDLTIMNRWGKEVYRNEHYQNNWLVDVEAGTYYYYIKHTDECNEFKGWLQVIR